MPSENLARVLQEVRALTEIERQELRERLDAWPTPSQSSIEDNVDGRLLVAGVIDHVPAPPTDLNAYRRWKPIAIKGTPLSRTIVAERR